MALMFGVLVTVNATELLQTPFCRTCAFPEFEPEATLATIWPSLQLMTDPGAVPSDTCPVPCTLPKPDPVMVTCVPAEALVGVTLVMVAVFTVKETELETAPFCETRTIPEAEPVDTVAVIWVSLQLTTAPKLLPKYTVPEPCVVPKPEPVIVTWAPAAPVFGDTLVMAGVGRTVNSTGLLFAPDIVTTTLPVVAPDGTMTEILVGLQFVAVAAMPLNVTVLLPCAVSKPLPRIATMAPTGPAAGVKPVTISGTVKLAPLLTEPSAVVTTTFPVVAPAGTYAVMLVSLQLPMDAEVPLKVTLWPNPVPKFDPAIVTKVPGAPDVGDKLVIEGAETTVNNIPLLFTLDTVTTTLPVVAPDGTATTMPVGPQLATVAAVPLKVTVLAP